MRYSSWLVYSEYKTIWSYYIHLVVYITILLQNVDFEFTAYNRRFCIAAPWLQEIIKNLLEVHFGPARFIGTKFYNSSFVERIFVCSFEIMITFQLFLNTTTLRTSVFSAYWW